MKPTKTLLIALAGHGLLIAAIAGAVMAAESTHASPAILERSPAMPVEKVRYQLKHRQTITLVDVRRPEDFERLHIPGSLNLALHAVKTKDFLKSSPLVLVNDGFHHTPLEIECRRLRKLGFDASVLDGGLRAWNRMGGPWVGDLSALPDMQTVAPRIFFLESRSENNLMLDISPVRSEASRNLVPDARHLPERADTDRWETALKRVLSHHTFQPFGSILVFNESGEGYERFAMLTERMGVDAFYLQGGIAGYKRYLNNLARLRQPRNSRMVADNTCGPCNGEAEESIATVLESH